MNKVRKIWNYQLILSGFILMFAIDAAFGQDARVVTFKHAIRWLSESDFPNYFLNEEIRNSINENLKAGLKYQFNFKNVTIPDQVEYRNFTGFGKPKNAPSKSSTSLGYEIDIFSFLTRETTGYGLLWSVKMVIRNKGKIILEKEVRHEIEYTNDISASQQLLSSTDFQKIFIGLIRETISMESEYTGTMTITIGRSMEEKEKDIRLWFPGSIRYILKTNATWPYFGNFSSLLVSERDTVLQFDYKNKSEVTGGSLTLKPALSEIFTDATGIGMEYTVKEKGMKKGVIKFHGGNKFMIKLNWIEEKTSTTNSDEVQSRITTPLVGQLFSDTTKVGSFIYQRISKALPSDATNEKFSLTNGNLAENSSAATVIHHINGTLNSKLFTAEYNEKTGLIEINSANQTLATMLFHNCNPGTGRSQSKTKNSMNEGAVSEEEPKAGFSSSKKTSKLKWYPYFMKGHPTGEEVTTSLEILVCLFFGMGNM